LEHRGELVLVDERLFGEAAQPEALVQAGPVSGQARCISRSAYCRLRMFALEGPARQTSSACSARLRERTYDVISDADLRDVGSDCGHDTRDFVTKHRRCRNKVVSGEEQVGVTQPGRSHVDENFAPNRRGDVDIFEVEPVTNSVQYKCLHLWPPKQKRRRPIVPKRPG
jgi:hypothetical protein